MSAAYNRLIRLPEVLYLTGLSRSALYRHEAAGNSLDWVTEEADLSDDDSAVAVVIGEAADELAKLRGDLDARDTGYTGPSLPRSDQTTR